MNEIMLAGYVLLGAGAVLLAVSPAALRTVAASLLARALYVEMLAAEKQRLAKFADGERLRWREEFGVIWLRGK